MSRQKVFSASEAARLIPDGAIVTVSSSSALGCPDSVLKAIRERFEAEGRPRNITTLRPIAAGDMWGVKGIDHLAKPGCLARVMAGSYPSGPSSAEPPAIWKMINGDAIPAYNVPSGILFDTSMPTCGSARTTNSPSTSTRRCCSTRRPPAGFERESASAC
jgi:propionate CoA-transferase